MELKVLLDLTAKNILQILSEEEIYVKYMSPGFKFNTPFSSPLRKDKRPSFIIGNKNNSYRYKDFTTGDSGNCFNFVSKLLGLNFNDTLIAIVNDFGIKRQFKILSERPYQFKVGSYDNPTRTVEGYDHCVLKVKPRKFNEKDLIFWNQFGIDESMLRICKVFAISYYSINGTNYRAEEYAYVFVESKDGEHTYKVYQPYSKIRKWLNNNNGSIWELWNLMPESGKELIITSSRKDAMSIMSTVGIPSISLQAETTKPKIQIIEELANRFETIYIFYDNDYDKEHNWGQIAANKIIEDYPLYNIKNIFIDRIMSCKDYSDLVKSIGIIYASDYLKQILIN